MSALSDEVTMLIATITAPHRMSKRDALEFLDEVIDEIKMMQDALRDEIGSEEGQR